MVDMPHETDTEDIAFDVGPEAYDYQAMDAFYGYCPRDRLLILGDKIVVPNMAMAVRNQEIHTYSYLSQFEPIPVDDAEAKFDAANICRLGKDLLYLVSASGNARGADWLQANFPEYTVHRIEGLYHVLGDRSNSSRQFRKSDSSRRQFKNAILHQAMKWEDAAFLHDYYCQMIRLA